MSDFSKFESNDRLETAQVELGTRNHQPEEASFRNVEVSGQSIFLSAEANDIDATEPLIQAQIQAMAYQSALAVSGRVTQPTLLDFLR